MQRTRTYCARSARAPSRKLRNATCTRSALDQLDLVTVGILHERDDRRTALHRACLARDGTTVATACRTHGVAGRCDVLDLDRNVAVRGAEIVAIDAVV